MNRANFTLSSRKPQQMTLPALPLLAETGDIIATGSPGHRRSKRPTPSHLRRTSLCTKRFRTTDSNHVQFSSQSGTEPKSTRSCRAPHSLQHINTHSLTTSSSHFKVQCSWNV